MHRKKLMKTNLTNPQPQQLTDDQFTFPEPEVTEEAKAPAQLDVTLAQGPEAEEVPLVGEVEEEIKEVKPTKAATPKAIEKKPDFLTVMRENNLEVFTKESVTNDVSDEEFANQLISDKHFGEKSYPKELDTNEYEYYPEEVSKHVEALKDDIGRVIANLTPNEQKTISTVTGVNELVYNKYLEMAHERAAATVVLGGVTGIIAAPIVVGAAATATAFAAGAGVAIGALYLAAETANSIDRANRTSPEEIKGMQKTTGNLSLVETIGDLADAEKFNKFMADLLQRDEHDDEIEAYVKEFSHAALDF